MTAEEFDLAQCLDGVRRHDQQAAAALASRRAVLERYRTSTTAGFRNQTDLVTAEAEVKEAEMTALADQALADFAAREGISIKGAAAPAPAERSMGETEKPQAQ